VSTADERDALAKEGALDPSKDHYSWRSDSLPADIERMAELLKAMKFHPPYDVTVTTAEFERWLAVNGVERIKDAPPQIFNGFRVRYDTPYVGCVTIEVR
jgi:hypothetical protein